MIVITPKPEFCALLGAATLLEQSLDAVVGLPLESSADAAVIMQAAAVMRTLKPYLKGLEAVAAKIEELPATQATVAVKAEPGANETAETSSAAAALPAPDAEIADTPTPATMTSGAAGGEEASTLATTEPEPAAAPAAAARLAATFVDVDDERHYDAHAVAEAFLGHMLPAAAVYKRVRNRRECCDGPCVAMHLNSCRKDRSLEVNCTGHHPRGVYQHSVKKQFTTEDGTRKFYVIRNEAGARPVVFQEHEDGTETVAANQGQKDNVYITLDYFEDVLLPTFADEYMLPAPNFPAPALLN